MGNESKRDTTMAQINSPVAVPEQRTLHSASRSPSSPEAADAQSDRDLVARVLSGDADALSTLHKRYYTRVYRIALCRCASRDEAEDIAGETFVRAITHLRAYRFQSESLLPWLGRIAANLIADQRRRQRQAPFVSLDAPTADGLRVLLDGLRDDAPLPQVLAERAELRDVLRTIIAQLPPDQCEAVLLRYGSDLPLAEIAVALNRSEGAIKSLLHRALDNLRRRLLEGARENEYFAQLRGNVAPTATETIRNNAAVATVSPTATAAAAQPRMRKLSDES